jgi:hypothetical protein
MATVLEECFTEEQLSGMRFFVGKRTECKRYYIELFHVYGGKCLSRKAVHNWIETFSQGHWKVQYDARSGAELADNNHKTSTLRVSTHW